MLMKTIPNWPRYSITKEGVVVSLRKNKPLKPGMTTGGYLGVVLCDNTKRWSVKVHSLMAMTYLGKRPEGYQINHKDGDKLNNKLENLEYVTPSENIKHAYKLGLITTNPRGEKARNAKLTQVQVDNIRSLISSGYTNTEIARKYSISRTTVYDIKVGNSW